ncbi:helix-turn-helix domain-containing protein [Halorhodospira halophila]|uniref:helix-turn-helix domain-containing protein n=1 Tax=Halorhodospira halophila TaxID=1053 RepID=UPI00191267D6|nr:XRE family transcriptional regulator [Halorhodospira halophila]
MSIGKRIKEAREHLSDTIGSKVTQRGLAKMCGWEESQSRIGNYERDARTPSYKDILTIATVTGVRPEWLQFGTGDREPTSALGGQEHENVCPGPDPVRAIPEISWVQAGHWHEAVDPLHPGEAEEWHWTHKNVDPRAFLLRVQGDSMTAPHGRSYPPGCLILVDPGASPDPGKRVVARHKETSEVTFKELAYDVGRYYLKPLNPRYDMIEIDGEWEVIGVVRQAIMEEE